MSDTETIAAIERLRAMGAKRIRVGEIEVEFAGPPVTETRGDEDQRRAESPEQRQRREGEEGDRVLFAASG